MAEWSKNQWAEQWKAQRLAQEAEQGMPSQTFVRRVLAERGGQLADPNLDISGFAGPAVMGTVGRVAGSAKLLREKLPMNPDYVRYRADELGFNTQLRLYHSTPSDFKAFKLNADPKSHTGGGAIWLRTNPRENVAAHQVNVGFDWPGSQEMPLFARLTKEVPPSEYEALKLNPAFPRRITMAENERLRKLGYTHAVTENGREYAIFDPINIRSVFAKFDPDKRESSNLLYGVIPPTDHRKE